MKQKIEILSAKELLDVSKKQFNHFKNVVREEVRKYFYRSLENAAFLGMTRTTLRQALLYDYFDRSHGEETKVFAPYVKKIWDEEINELAYLGYTILDREEDFVDISWEKANDK